MQIRLLRKSYFVLFILSSSCLQAKSLLSPDHFTLIQQQHNSTTWAAKNLHDVDTGTRWLSRQGTNDLNYVFDTLKSEACFSEFSLTNYGVSNRSIRQFVLLSSGDKSLAADAGTTGWTPLIADPSPSGLIDHLSWAQGARITEINSQLNSTFWAAEHLNDGDLRSIWLSRYANNTIEFEFDSDWSGRAGDAINIEQIQAYNYGSDDRSVKHFQIEVSEDGSLWRKLAVPGTAAGDSDFNFLLQQEGGKITSVYSQLNTTSWAAKNIHDGDQNTRWLSRYGNNTLDFAVDPDRDGTTGAEGDTDDQFTLDKFYLRNYGTDDRSIRQFQIEIKTHADSNWTRLPVPGSISGASDFEFLYASHGAQLTAINSQLNRTSWAAANIHDGDQSTRWLSRYSNNTLDFEMDVDGDGNSGLHGDPDDLFKIKKIYLKNYGNDDRSVRQFQVEVKTASNSNWQKIKVPGSVSGEPDHNFALQTHGGNLSVINSQHNTTGWAAKNIHDGDQNTRWLSRKENNTLEFEFDTNHDGVHGDTINLDTIEFYNYGNDDRSVATFEIDIHISGSWQSVISPASGTTTFNANMDSSGQQWDVGPFNDVDAVRLRTLTNHGDPSYTGARELILSGDSVAPSYTFSASMHGNGEEFELDTSDQPDQVTAVRFRTISNHGDPSYIGAREFNVYGDSITRSYTFTAGMHGNGETFVLDPEDRPSNVTNVRLHTINNHGDPNYTGAREFKVFGPSLGPSHTFTLPMSAGPHTITLDADDYAKNIIHARLITISNHGDPSYTGLRELSLLGQPVGPSYIFEAENHGTEQTFSFNERVSNVFRFRSLNNYGDYYIGASEFSLKGNIGSSCGCTLGSFQITQPVSGIACPSTRVPISIKAICDDGVTAYQDYTGTIQLSAAADSSLYLTESGGSPIAEYSFDPSDNGSKTLYLYHANAADTTPVNVTALDRYEGVKATSKRGTLFGSQGIRVATAPTNFTCGKQTNILLQAYGQKSGGSCDVLTDFNGKKPMKAWFDASTDLSGTPAPSGTPLVINSTAILDRAEPSSTNLTLNFNAGETKASLAYDNAAQIDSLHLLYDQTPYSGSPFSPLRADSRSFVATPEKLHIEIPELLTPATDQHSHVLKRAGETFTMKASALCSGGTTATQYLSQSNIQLSSAVQAPISGHSGTLLTQQVSIDSDAIDGIKEFDQSQSEVGIFTFDANIAANSYFGASIGPADSISGVGRFSADHFAISAATITNRSALACSSSLFSYMDERFSLNFDIEAKNLNGDTTQNYSGTFAKLDIFPELNLAASTEGTDLSSRLQTDTFDILWPALSHVNAGKASAQVNLEFQREHTPDGPFPNVDLGIAPDDGDHQPSSLMSLSSYNLDVTGDSTDDHYHLGSSDFRFGRFAIENTYGPETENLSMSAETQYWNGSRFLQNTDDSCTVLNVETTPAGPLGIIVGSGTSDLSFNSSNVINGNLGMSFSAPGSGNQGTVDVKVYGSNPDIGLSDLNWLLFDWDNDGNHDNDPGIRTVTFGRYRGNDRLLFWKGN